MWSSKGQMFEGKVWSVKDFMLYKLSIQLCGGVIYRYKLLDCPMLPTVSGLLMVYGFQKMLIGEHPLYYITLTFHLGGEHSLYYFYNLQVKYIVKSMPIYTNYNLLI